MEALTRLVTESLARHGFDRPLDYRRLHWSRWFRCESHHSLLFVPSKPGVFAVAQEIMDLSAHGGADALVRPAGQSPACGAGSAVWDRVSDPLRPSEARQHLAANQEGHDFSPAESVAHGFPALAAERIDGGKGIGTHAVLPPRRMLAVTKFFEDDDMAFVLDRMLSSQNPMHARLISGRYFVRFVVIEDQVQRRSICSALNQWMASSAEKATGIGSHFASSLELTPATEYVPQPNEAQGKLFEEATDSASENGDVARAPSPASAGITDASVGRTLLSAAAGTTDTHVATGASPVPPARSAAESVRDRVSDPVGPSEARQDFAGSITLQRRAEKLGIAPAAPHATASQLDSGAATNIHCPSPFPSGF